MKKLFFIFHLLAAGFQGLRAQNIYDSIQVGGVTRTYMTHLPEGYNPAGNYPLVLGFHGGQQAATSAQGWAAFAYQSKLSQKADSSGFIVVYPEGLVFNQNRTWNAGNCCQPAMGQGYDDVGFVDALLTKLIADYAVDTSRVYATGSSNGGMLCYRLACELSHRFAAIAPNAASQMLAPCNPSRTVPVISFHSKADPIVFHNGGFGGNPILANVYFPSQDSTLRIWQQQNNCLQRDTLVSSNGNGFDFIKLSSCSCNAELHHYATSDGGHSWPGGNPNNNPVSIQINATRLLWDFFQQHALGCLNTQVKEQNGSEISAVFPNPAGGQISVSGMKEPRPFTIIDTRGRRVSSGIADGNIDISGLSPGLYLLKAVEKTMVRNFRFVKL